MNELILSCQMEIRGDFQDHRAIWMEFLELIKRLPGVLVINSIFHVFPNGGFSGLVLIGESHAAIHTWIEEGRAWVELATWGEFGWVDLVKGTFNPVCFCPGYLRGLSFIGNFAVMGLSKPRENKTFSGLALDERLEDRKMEPRCGLYVVDLAIGDTVHSLTMEGVVTELYDVAVIPGRIQPAALGPGNAEIKRMISIGGRGAGNASFF